VIIETANEYNALLYDHEILRANRTENGIAELILLAKSRFAGLDFRLPVSVSSRDLLFPGALREASDLVLVHGNLDAPRKDGPAIAKPVNDPTVHAPVVINEDFNGFGVAQSNLDEDTITASDVVAAGESWGLTWRVYNQYYPSNWAVGSSPDISGGSRANYFRAILDHMGRLTGDVAP